jgi:hypothetical protein
MNLWAYTGNSLILNKLPEEDRENVTTISALGLIWNTETDTISLKWNIKNNEILTCTSRTVLKNVSSIFDPLNLFAPWMVEAKLFLQNLIRISREWEQEFKTKELKSTIIY